MTTDNYHLALRDLRAQLRAKKYEDAYLNAAILRDAHPDVEEVTAFRAAVARKLHADMREASRSGAYDRAAALAELLIADQTYAASAQDVLLNAVTQSDDPAASVQTLLRYAADDSSNLAWWGTIGTLMGDLDPTEANIEIGFNVLRILPGHSAGLAGLSSLVHRFVGRDAADAPALLPREVEEIVLARKDVVPSASRSTSYDLARTTLNQARAASPIDHLRQRLTLEEIIGVTERRGQAGTVTPLDSWSALDAKSPHYALHNGITLSPVAVRIMTAAPDDALHHILIRRVQSILSLWLQSTNRDISRDRIGYLWLVFDPLIHILLICAVPLLIHRSSVMDMAVFPFAVVGACFWLVFRLAASGAMSGGGVLVSQLEHPPLRRFDIIFARALHALVVYVLVGAMLLIVAIMTGQSSFPENLPMVLILLILNWAIGLAYGIIGGSLLYIYPGFRRINGFLIRIYGLSAGLFYVTELIPERISSVLLLNPLLHGVQLGRSFWFPEYETTDASWTYLLLWLGGLTLLALILLTLDERRVQRVRA